VCIVHIGRKKVQWLYIFSSVKTLGEPEEDEDTLSWVDKLRKKDEEKRRAKEKVNHNQFYLLSISVLYVGYLYIIG